ncbi:MAG: 2-C-methyl-D-erythritol 4-phosphate cytidylyltransferase [Bacteroidales bacterium]|nr:2-C-methyl-D-erythritol 4-phosphate cytidylyltransferase [Bacteroidales bacterium]HPY82204.1 2-C-methyl-D-erythritol 4-phosphate cytidylyltransferase [Bacteroidales bacterium]
MSIEQKKYAIIVAGGQGSRMNSSIPKQYMILKNKPVLLYSLEAFFLENNATEIIVVLPSQHIDEWKKICSRYSITIPHTIVSGGEERFFSVQNGIRHIHAPGLVAVHDGVRPLINPEFVRSAYMHAAKHKTAIPVIDSVDSLRQITEHGSVILHRNTIKRVQTPQVFDSQILIEAYKQAYSQHFTDDASVVEHAGIAVSLFLGHTHNNKITTPDDLLFAEAILSNKD